MLFSSCCTIFSSIQLISPSLGSLNNPPISYLAAFSQPSIMVQTAKNIPSFGWLPSLNYQLISNKNINQSAEESPQLINQEFKISQKKNYQSIHNLCPAIEPKSIKYSQVKSLGKPYKPVEPINTLPIDFSTNNDSSPQNFLQNIQHFFVGKNIIPAIASQSVNKKIVATIANYQKNPKTSLTFTSFNLKSNNYNQENNLFEVRINNSLIAVLDDRQRAEYMKEQLNQLLNHPQINANQIQPTMINGIPGGRIGEHPIFLVNSQLGVKLNQNPELLTIEWVNNIRQAMNFAPLTIDRAQITMYGLTETNQTFEGSASWYGSDFHGRRTANGETYNQFELTVAHKTLPFNTYLKLVNPDNGKSVVVRVNDRGPYIPPRSLDLSAVAARCLGSEKTGVIKYQATILQ